MLFFTIIKMMHHIAFHRIASAAPYYESALNLNFFPLYLSLLLWLLPPYIILGHFATYLIEYRL